MADWGNIAFDARGQLVDVTDPVEPGPPPDMTWTQIELHALTGGPLMGTMVAISSDRLIELYLVAVSDIFTDEAGAWVLLVPYDRYCTWGHLPAKDRPRTPTPARAVAAKHVWVMHPKQVANGR